MTTPFTKFVKPSLSKPQQSGITLTELMIAAFITIGSVSIGGWAIANMITSSKTSGSQNERRVELNRSLDFMASEIRQSTQINSDTAPSEFSPASSEVDTTTVKAVLRLRVDGLTKPVIYYTATPASSNTAWRGPQVIYRWGPSFTSAGVYGADKSTPSTWTHQPLVDAIDSSATTSVTCPTSPAPTASGSPVPWTVSPASGATGFYACVDPNNKIAQIFNKGRITKVLGQTAPYVASAQAFTRSSGSSTPTFSISGGSFILGVNADISVKVLGSDLRCSSGASPVNTAAVVNVVRSGVTTASAPLIIDPPDYSGVLNYPNEVAGTSVNFTGSVPITSNPNYTCGIFSAVFNSITHSSQVRVLKHGDTVPTVGGWGGGASVDTFLTSYVNSDGTKISLPDPSRQAIILYELYSTSPGNSTFDLQDMVLLVTANPD